MAFVRIFFIGLLFLVVVIFARVAETATDSLILSCQTIPADTSAADLLVRFGTANVTDGQVYLGEGQYEAGTLLFATIPDQRAEITWKEAEARRAPHFVRVRGEKSRWRTPQGLTLGQDLTFVERLNRRPFRLRGFGWDYGGTTTSWSGGVLAQAELPQCTIWARFLDKEDRLSPEKLRLVGQVFGEPEFSSGHPGMQAAHAYVHEIGLGWLGR